MKSQVEKYIENIDLQTVSMQTLAFIGDAVYNVYIRTYLASKTNAVTGRLHKESIKYVSAKGQSTIIDEIYENLSEDEKLIYKRGRNTSINAVSKNVSVVEYKKATGFEALIGYLYIKEEIIRLEEIIDISIKIFE